MVLRLVGRCSTVEFQSAATVEVFEDKRESWLNEATCLNLHILTLVSAGQPLLTFLHSLYWHANGSKQPLMVLSTPDTKLVFSPVRVRILS